MKNKKSGQGRALHLSVESTDENSNSEIYKPVAEVASQLRYRTMKRNALPENIEKGVSASLVDPERLAALISPFQESQCKRRCVASPFYFIHPLMKAKLSTLLYKTKSPAKAGLLHLSVESTDENSNSIVEELQILAGLKAYLANS